MCGRYAATRGSAELGALFDAEDETGGVLAADYNIAPTDRVPIVRLPRAGTRLVSAARWGLVPHWARDTRGAARMINARAETVATSGAFAPSFAGRRCLVPADGWYEWVRRPDGAKQPYFMTPRDGSVLAFAGLWSMWSDRSPAPPSTSAGVVVGDAVAPDSVAAPAALNSAAPPAMLTCAIVTMPAVGDLTEVHDRMPLLLSPDRWSAWLAGGGDAEALLATPTPEVIAGIEIRPVGREVGDVRNDGPELISRVAAPPPRMSPEGPVSLTLF